jgi:hypothetical protein
MNDLFKRTGSEDFSKYLKVMVSGPPKSGKTTLLGTVPGILVLDTEPHANNLESIAHLDVPYVTIKSSDDLRQVAMVLGNESLRKQLAQNTYGMPDINGVAIDTLDTLQKILKQERMKEQRSTQFLRDDWGWLKTEMEKIVEMFTALPMHVFFMVHTKTQEMGKGDDAYTTVLPGLEGAIAQSIAGMVGYSLLSFRKEEIAPDGSVYTKYWLRTEGDRVHEFLGTRTAGKLPTIIEPNMKTIYDTVMANRPAPKPQAQAPSAAPAQQPVAPPTQDEQAQPEVPAQNAGQAEQVQTPVQTTQAAPAPEASAPAAALPEDSEPITPAAMGHVKRVYDAIEVPFPQQIVEGLTMGEARNIVRYWRAVMEDHKGDPTQADAQEEMRGILQGYGWMPDANAPAAPEPKTVTPKIDGTIEEVQAYITQGGDGVDLDRVQQAYDLEIAKGDGARKGLISKLEGYGAKPPVESTEQVQTPAETPSQPVTQPEAVADVSSTEEEAVKAVEEGLNAETVAVIDGIPEGAPCDVCGNPIDDLDLAELGQKRFGKVLCVDHYLAEQKK